MRPVRTIELTHAAAIDGHGRTRAVELLISERNALIRAAAKFYPGCSGREIARQLHTALLRYHGGRWQRDRSETSCPPQHKGKLVQVMWMILKTNDAPVGARTIRRALTAAATRGPPFEM